MYKILTSSIVSVLILFYIYSGNVEKSDLIRITYSKTIEKKADTIVPNSYNDEIKKFQDLLEYNSNDLYYELTILDFHSEFKQNKILISDEENKIFKKLAGSIGGTKGEFYVNKKDSIFY